MRGIGRHGRDSGVQRSFQIEELEYRSRHAQFEYEYVSGKRSNGFAHIGEAFKGFFDKRPEELLKQTELFLGLGQQRALNVELSSWTPAKGDTIAVLVSIHPQRSFVDNIQHFVFRFLPVHFSL